MSADDLMRYEAEAVARYESNRIMYDIVRGLFGAMDAVFDNRKDLVPICTLGVVSRCDGTIHLHIRYAHKKKELEQSIQLKPETATWLANELLAVVARLPKPEVIEEPKMVIALPKSLAPDETLEGLG